jgi:hypothetical protein
MIMYRYDAAGFLTDDPESYGHTDQRPPAELRLPRFDFDEQAWVEGALRRAWVLDDDGHFLYNAYWVDPRDTVLTFTADPLPSGTMCEPQYQGGTGGPGLVTGGAWVDLDPRPMDELVQAKAGAKQLIDLEREKRLRAGAPHTFGAVEDRVQTRFERDLVNIAGRAMDAMLLQSQNVTDPVLPFRADSNTTYLLTPTEMIAMARAVSDYVSATYQTSWDLKDAISAATTLAEVDAVAWPAD